MADDCLLKCVLVVVVLEVVFVVVVVVVATAEHRLCGTGAANEMSSGASVTTTDIQPFTKYR